LEITDEQDSSSRLLFTVDKEELYKLRQSDDEEKLIHMLLRSYTGLFTEFAYINEDLIAERLKWERQKVYEYLVKLAKNRIVQYIPRKKTPFIVFTREREATKYLQLGKEVYEDRRERFISRINSVLNYAQEENICRSQLLLSYFGEKNTRPCGKCDVCLKKKETMMRDKDFVNIRAAIQQILSHQSSPLDMLVKKIPYKEPKVIEVIRFMLDNGQIKENNQMQLFLTGKEK